MAKISHFVVTYNHETGAFDIDNATATARFEEGLVWDTVTERWLDTFMDCNDQTRGIDWSAGEELNDALHRLNIENGVEDENESED